MQTWEIVLLVIDLIALWWYIWYKVKQDRWNHSYKRFLLKDFEPKHFDDSTAIRLLKVRYRGNNEKSKSASKVYLKQG